MSSGVMMSASYDVIVIGTGGMGSATCFHLAKQGVRVLGIERFHIAHDRGSSHGETRIVRRAYFEHPDYVPLLNRAFELWTELGPEIFTQNGMVLYGHATTSAVCAGSIASAEQHSIPIERWDSREARRRHSIYRPPEGFAAVYEPGAGFVRVEKTVSAHADRARALGAEIHERETVLGFEAAEGSVSVKTDRGSYSAAKLIVTGGAWSGQLLKELGLPLRIRRMVLYWFKASQKHALANGVPCFAFDLEDDFYYGFPMLDGMTVKLAAHRSGDAIDDPSQLDLPPEGPPLARLDAARTFVRDCLPEVSSEIVKLVPCMYTMTPDENFIIDTHPGHRDIVFAAGFSGHGFKFAPVVGEVLAELALRGKTRHPVGFLGLERFKEQRNPPKPS
jgi:monomeric sarcosine oxidase